MNWLEFISSVVTSIAWPTVSVIAIVVFKDALLEAAPRLNRLSYKEFVAEFDHGLDQIEQEVKEAGLVKIETTQVVEDREENLRQLATISPSAAIIETFRHIEKSARALIQTTGIEPDYKVAAPYRLIERILEQSDALGVREIKIFRDLRQLRNKITHGKSFEATFSQAIEYIDLASLLLSKIEKATAQKVESQKSASGQKQT